MIFLKQKSGLGHFALEHSKEHTEILFVSLFIAFSDKSLCFDPILSFGFLFGQVTVTQFFSVHTSNIVYLYSQALQRGLIIGKIISIFKNKLTERAYIR